MQTQDALLDPFHCCKPSDLVQTILSTSAKSCCVRGDLSFHPFSPCWPNAKHKIAFTEQGCNSVHVPRLSPACQSRESIVNRVLQWSLNPHGSYHCPFFVRFCPQDSEEMTSRLDCSLHSHRRITCTAERPAAIVSNRLASAIWLSRFPPAPKYTSQKRPIIVLSSFRLLYLHWCFAKYLMMVGSKDTSVVLDCD